MWYLTFKKCRKLSVGFQTAAGRGGCGRQTIFSKGSTRVRKVFRIINNTFVGLSVSTLVCQYQKDPGRTSMLALVCNALGCWFYLPQTTSMTLYGYVRLATPALPEIFAS
jgi:ribosomal protein L2